MTAGTGTTCDEPGQWHLTGQGGPSWRAATAYSARLTRRSAPGHSRIAAVSAVPNRRYVGDRDSARNHCVHLMWPPRFCACGCRAGDDIRSPVARQNRPARMAGIPAQVDDQGVSSAARRQTGRRVPGPDRRARLAGAAPRGPRRGAMVARLQSRQSVSRVVARQLRWRSAPARRRLAWLA